MISIGVDLLRNMNISINIYDEPRVLVSFDMLQHLLQGGENPQRRKSNSPRSFVDISEQTNWDFVTQSCPPDSPARSSVMHGESPSDAELSFISNNTQVRDLCQETMYRDLHGLFLTPATFSTTNTLVPVFSQGGPSTFQDIFYPTPYYLGSSGSYNADADGPFHEKQNRLYWAGSSTGGNAHYDTYRRMHRHRLIEFANNNDRPIVLLRETEPNKWTQYEDKMGSVSDLFDVKFTTFWCEDPGTPACEEQASHYRITKPEPQEASYGSKLVIDLDGNSFSGRYYRLLRSRSAVLKQTLMKEWHDDWLVPWVHYIPISMGIVELPEVVRFLSLDPRGLKVAEDVAEQGRSWADRALRMEDMSLFLVRILMEYGRLLSDDRDTQRCCDTQGSQ